MFRHTHAEIQLAFSAPDVSSLRFLVELDISHNAFESIDRLCGVVRAESIEQQEHPLPRLQVLRMDGASHFSRQNQFRLPPRTLSAKFGPYSSTIRACFYVA